MFKKGSKTWKKLKKLAKYSSLLAIMGAVVLLCTDGYVKKKAGGAISSEEAVVDAEQKADAILVLGAQVKPDGKPCLMLKDGWIRESVYIRKGRQTGSS